MQSGLKSNFTATTGYIGAVEHRAEPWGTLVGCRHWAQWRLSGLSDEVVRDAVGLRLGMKDEQLSIAKECKVNPKKLWNFVKSKSNLTLRIKLET